MTSLRYAWRSLAKSPGFVMVAVLALGMGLGLSTTMFAVLDAVVNPFMPYRDPGSLYHVGSRYSYRAGFSLEEFGAALRDGLRPIASGAEKVQLRRVPLEPETDGRDVNVTVVTPAFFELVGVRPRLGRPFVAGDGDDVALVSDGLWRQRFGRRRALDGATIRLGDRRYAIVGVMPRGSTFPFAAAAWLPAASDSNSLMRFDAPIIRLRPGVTREAADLALRSLAPVLTERFDMPSPVGLWLNGATERRTEIQDLQIAMVGSALVVLLIACVNLAQLMLARGLARRRELALRLALGAGRAAVVRQMFLECALITTCGAALGAVVAVWGADVLRHRMPPSVAWFGLIQPQLSWRVFAMSALAVAAAAVLFGLIPAVRVALQVDMNEPLKDGAGTTVRWSRRRYSPLVVVEVALALVLLMAGGLLLRTVAKLQEAQFSFDARTLLTARVGVTWHDSNAVRFADLSDMLARVPGVQGVAWSSADLRLLGGIVSAELVTGEPTRTLAHGAFGTGEGASAVSWNYLRVHRLPILRGRDFEPGDVEGERVAILSTVAAAQLYPGKDAVGHMIKLGGPATAAPWARVVGVARTPAVLRGTADEGIMGSYVWLPESGRRLIRFATFLIRSETRDAQVAVQVRTRLRAVPRLWVMGVEPFASGRAADVASRAFLAKVFVGMGAVALALAALGLYGVLAYAVGQRMREFAVRIALGAQPAQLFRMVLHDGLVMLLAGTGIGAFAALAAMRYLDAVVEVVFRTDAVSLVGAEALLIVVGLAAAFAPARRAVRANPLDILRAV